MAWSEEPVFDYLKQAYLLAAASARSSWSTRPRGSTRRPAPAPNSSPRQYLNALSPANFAFTNPEAIRRAIDTGSISLLSGLANLLADAADRREARRSAAPRAEFELGKDIAATPGSVVFQNELMQLIQYAPTTDEVCKRPLLYVPPLVNKYYLLDLQPKSLADPLAGRAGPHASSSSPGSIPAPSSPTRASPIIIALGPDRRARRDREGDRRARGRPVRLLHGRHPRRHRARLARARRARAAGSPRRPRSARCSISPAWASGRPSPSPSSCGRWSGISLPRASWPRRSCRPCSAVGPRQRSDLVVGGQPLSARPRGAALRHPPLVRRRRPHPARLPARLGAATCSATTS